MTYQLHPRQGVINTDTEEHIKRNHPAWPEYQAWVKAGNTPDPAPVELEPLETLFRRVVSQINQRRNAIEQSVFPYMDTTFDSNQVSAIRIAGAVGAAQAAFAMGMPFDIAWTDSTNNDIPMTGEQIMGMPLAMAIHSNTVHQLARVLKDEATALLESGDRAGLESFEIFFEGFDEVEGALE